jgi:DNA (cytosine-5)-methyltransferase 1
MTTGRTMASIFSGGGGWEVGALAAGFRPLWGVELDEEAAEVHDANIPGDIHVGDVAQLDPRELSRPDVFCMSPPCQAWSEARRSAKRERCDAHVGSVGLRFVAELAPRVVFLEEVPKYAKSRVFQDLVRGLREMGYSVRFRTFPSTHFGVSQKRPRLLMVASLDDIGRWPPAVEPLGWYEDVADLIPYLPPAAPLAAWQLRGMDPCVPELFPVLVVGGNPTGCRIDGRTYRKSWYGPDQTGPTMVASGGSMTGARIWDGAEVLVRFTPRCGARVMGFPDSYALPTSPGVAWSVIGNAVPPPISFALFDRFGDPERGAA